MVVSGDGETRIPPAVELFRQGAAPFILVTGGLDNPPYSRTAKDMADIMVGRGVAPDRIIIDNDSMHTQEQARFVTALAKARQWHRILLVASPYHTFRVYLTFLRALLDEGIDKTLHLVNVPASHAPWWQAPEGLVKSRADLLDEEFSKIDHYGADGHVASYEEGLAYLRFWETAK